MVLISLTAEKPVWCNGLLRCFAGRQIPGEGQYDLPHSLRYPEHHLQCLREKPNRTYLRISMLLFVSDGLLLTVFSLTRPEFCEAIVSSENITRRNQWKKMENCVSE